MRSSSTFLPAAIGIIFWLAGTGQAFAYLDPGTGSFVMQILIGSIAGGLMVVKLYWNSIRGHLLKFLPGKRGSEVCDKADK